MPELDLLLVWNFATALLIGALVGIERERHKQRHDHPEFAGLRTFVLFALLGGALRLAHRDAGVTVDPCRGTARGDGGGLRRLRVHCAHGPGGARPDDGARRHRDLPARRRGDPRPARTRRWPGRHRRRRARLQGPAARVRREAWQRRRLRRAQAADRDVHHPAAAAERAARPLRSPQPAVALAAGAADLRPVAGRLRADTAARGTSRHPAHRTDRRPGLLDGGDAGVCAAEPRPAVRRAPRGPSRAASCWHGP